MGRQSKSKALTISTLASEMSATYGLSERLMYRILREGVDRAASAICDGRRVVLSGLGTFTLRQKVALMRHKGPYGVIDVPARNRPHFRPAKWLNTLELRPPLPEPTASLADECPV